MVNTYNNKKGAESIMPNTKSCGLPTTSVHNHPNFTRRNDLTPLIRLQIAYQALMAKAFGEWGKITALARQFVISRTFVYNLAYMLEQTNEILFNAQGKDPSLINHRFNLSYMLSLKLEGRCSIEAISTIMKRFDINTSSVGSISEYLFSFGSLLPSTLSAYDSKAKIIIFLSDELFSNSSPILITVDPNSSAILKLELANSRKADDWKRHWTCLEENGFYAAYLVCDEGKGLCTAKQEALPDKIRQSDTYHAIAHQLGQWAIRLEKSAYRAIQLEDDCYKKLDSARSDKVINRRIDQYEEARKDTIKAIELYEAFQFLYHCLIEQLNVFNSDGGLRSRIEAEENITLGLDMIETLGMRSLTDSVNKVRRTLPNLFHYFDVAQKVVSELQELGIDKEVLRALCLAWQWNKSKIKAKHTTRSKQCGEHEQICLEFAVGHLQENYDDIKEQVYQKLDQIVQSSALVECINSIIRPYLDSCKNNITQEMLNLIMFYHNHRCYKHGKRAGKTPMEILTGKKQEKDWIEILFDFAVQ
jgi:ribosomal protein S6